MSDTEKNLENIEQDAQLEPEAEAASKPKMSKRKKIAIGVVSAIVAVLAIAGVAAGVYYNNLQSSIILNHEDADEIRAALTPAEEGQPFYVLVIGSDDWEDHGARSDAMVLCRVDLEKPQVTMVTVPRDTPYVLDGQLGKLNTAYANYGVPACIKAVEEVTGVKINHFAEVEFDQFADVVEALGGIEVDVPYTIDYTVYTNDMPTVHIDAGKQVLNAEQAIAFARMRVAYSKYADLGQDAIRQANIRAMLMGILKSVLNAPATEIPGKITAAAKMVSTDIPLSDLISWATTVASKDFTVYSCTGPAAGGIDESTGLWLAYEAPEEWKTLMDVVNAGEDPTTVTGDNKSKDGKVDMDTTEVIGAGGTNQE